MEWLPNCLVMGITEEQFWTMNPRKIKPYSEAQRIRREQVDEEQWFLAHYIFESVSVAIGNLYRHKWESPKSYGDVRQKPILEEIREVEGDLTEEEKIERTKVLFKSLEAMQTAFERNHKFESAQSS